MKFRFKNIKAINSHAPDRFTHSSACCAKNADQRCKISYKIIWLKTLLWYKIHWKMKAGRAKIVIFQKMRIKNLSGGQWGPFPWKRRKTTSSATFCATGTWGLIEFLTIFLSFIFLLKFFLRNIPIKTLAFEIAVRKNEKLRANREIRII